MASSPPAERQEIAGFPSTNGSVTDPESSESMQPFPHALQPPFSMPNPFPGAFQPGQHQPSFALPSSDDLLITPTVNGEPLSQFSLCLWAARLDTREQRLERAETAFAAHKALHMNRTAQMTADLAALRVRVAELERLTMSGFLSLQHSLDRRSRDLSNFEEVVNKGSHGTYITAFHTTPIDTTPAYLSTPSMPIDQIMNSVPCNLAEAGSRPSTPPTAVSHLPTPTTEPPSISTPPLAPEDATSSYTYESPAMLTPTECNTPHDDSNLLLNSFASLDADDSALLWNALSGPFSDVPPSQSDEQYLEGPETKRPRLE
jgi:hypothetical protein